MKQTLALSILLAFGLAANAQNCKFDVDKKDAFTGAQTRSVVHKLDRSWRMGLADEGGKITVALSFIVPGDRRERISEGDSLLLKLEDGSVIGVAANGNFTPTATVAGTNILSYYMAMYTADHDILKKLGNSPITAVRFMLGSTPISLEIKEKHGSRISESAACLYKLGKD